MSKIFIARFEYGKPSLAKADCIKETEKSVMIKGYEDIFNTYYLPNRLAKGDYHCFFNLVEALNYLQEKCDAHLGKLQKQIQGVNDWKIKMSELEAQNEPHS